MASTDLRRVVLKGGPANGRSFDLVPGTAEILVPEMTPISAMSFAEGAPITASFITHRYDARSGDWCGPSSFNTNNTPSYKEQTPNMNLYEYAVLYLPKNDDGKLISADAKVLTEPKTALARSEEAVRAEAIQGLAGQSELDLDFVKVLVRPFA